eukprot:GFUD01041382.1.p1 GENE.GFUD01041382.1~~GFUD01041382.1.p1  ORF type:complete len:276 (-),score=58.03 GFUD01041382.1:33-836(-)
MVDLIYTGRSTANHAEFLSLQNLLVSLGIYMDIGWSKDSLGENSCAGFSMVIDDNPAGFHQIIRHKATKPRAVQEVSTREMKERMKGMEEEGGIGEINVDEPETTVTMMDSFVSNVSETAGKVIQKEPSKSYMSLKLFASKCAKSDNIVDTLSSTIVIHPNPITLSSTSVIVPNTGIPIQVAGADGNEAAVKQRMVKYRTDQGLFWRCLDCEYQTKIKYALFGHIESTHIVSAGYNCPYCFKFCRTRATLKMHVRAYHPEDSTKRKK